MIFDPLCGGRGYTILHRLVREKYFFTESTRPRTSIFSITSSIKILQIVVPEYNISPTLGGGLCI